MSLTTDLKLQKNEDKDLLVITYCLHWSIHSKNDN
ncbi:hypothetical protein FUAX_42130 (plasmid) [Fulvitalea axinellae]|uniref:Uncharacterized protein n=1 Tax=Fulvitalea axinellae TaxID=1182444 RepID=A0AAU9CI07_9BACT|nr:hypothetical protein FUAX_42130 [Fulvitalea axinellae]